MAEKILRTEYSEEMQKSYLDYSMSVITARAVPDIRDGLKPVQRRLLYDMGDLNVHHDKKEMKSARITGDCMGRFHPHGDSSIYETMVVMSQDFKRSVPLVDGKGNFGSIEGDSAAAYRYTEAKLKEFTDEVFLRDVETTVDYVPAYTNTEEEPVVLPVRVPNFLLNGSEGIAVGMTTSTPCHNLSELCRLCIAYVEDNEISLDKMMEIMPGPDFPTGGIISNKSELKGIYETGTGRLKIRGRLEFVPSKKRGEKDKLIVTEIPYTMIGSGIGRFMQDTAELVETKKLPEITDIGNASDAEGINIFLELKKDSDIERITNMLYKKTRLEDTFGVNMLAISGGRPEVLGLKGILAEWLKFQHEIIERKYRALLEKEEARREIQEGLIAACNIIDLIIAVIRGSRRRKDAEACLTRGETAGIAFKDPAMAEAAEKLRFTDRQARAILEMQLYKLIGLEIMELEKAHRATLKAIREYKKLTDNRDSREELIKKDLKDIIDKYGYPRKTLIEDSAEAVVEETPKESAACVFVMDRLGYCKLLDRALFEKNRETVRADNKYVVECGSLSRIMVFTSKGNLHLIRCGEVPLKKLKEKGIPLENISKYRASEEEIVYLAEKKDGAGGSTDAGTGAGAGSGADAGRGAAARVNAGAGGSTGGGTGAGTNAGAGAKAGAGVGRGAAAGTAAGSALPAGRDRRQGESLKADLIFLSKMGYIKRVEASEFDSNNRLVAATKLAEGDEVACMVPVTEIGAGTIAIWTREGFAIRYALDDIPLMKKASRGVRGIRLAEGDRCVGCAVVNADSVARIGKKDVKLSSLKIAVRGGKGTKQRSS